MRLRNVVALGLTPLRIKSQFDWEPADDYWGEDGEPLPGWAVAIVERGTLPAMMARSVTSGDTVTYYGADGRVQGTARRNGETTYFDDASGRSAGSARGQVGADLWPMGVEKGR